MLAGRLAFELCWLAAGVLAVDELFAVADGFEDVELVNEDGVGSTVLDVEREMTFLLLGAITSQTDAKELNAIRAKHSPSKRSSSPKRTRTLPAIHRHLRLERPTQFPIPESHKPARSARPLLINNGWVSKFPTDFSVGLNEKVGRYFLYRLTTGSTVYTFQPTTKRVYSLT